MCHMPEVQLPDMEHIFNRARMGSIRSSERPEGFLCQALHFGCFSDCSHQLLLQLYHCWVVFSRLPLFVLRHIIGNMLTVDNNCERSTQHDNAAGLLLHCRCLGSLASTCPAVLLAEHTKCRSEKNLVHIVSWSL